MKGISLRENDEVVGLDVAHENSEDEVLVVTEKGFGKRTPVSDYRLSNRGGMGIKTATITERNGNIVCITTVTGDEDIMVVTNHGVIIRMEAQDISQNGRAAQGVKLIRLGENQHVATVAKVNEEEAEDTESEEIASNDESSEQQEQVIEGDAPGKAIHTEVDDSAETDATDSSDEPEELRQDFMDRVNEDIQNDDDSTEE